MDASNHKHRAGLVALSGRSNVGKSTLLNRLVGEKIAAVSPRPQTTRRRILGVRSDPDAQLVMIDMPGIHEAKRLINQRMVELARKCVEEADVIVGMVEAAPRLKSDDRKFIESLRDLKQPKVVAINKLDMIGREQLIPLSLQCHALAPEAEIVPLSALSGDNIPELLATIKQLLPEGPSLMPEDQYTDQTERMLTQEIILEKIFAELRDEIPFSTAVKVEEFKEEAEGKFLRIAANIIVDRESHKPIVIGAGGLQLKRIGQAARVELEQLFDAHIFLQLTVKVEKNWTKDPRRVQQFAL